MIDINIYYFASDVNFDGKILYPRIPKNRMTTEENTIQRICVSKSIIGCLTAIGGFDIGDVVYIHQCQSNKVYQPTTKEVADSCFTGEEWILEPVKMKLFTTIKINGFLENILNNMHNDIYSFGIVTA